MRHPRMTTRRWMITVAVVALVLGGIVGAVRLKRRQEYFGSLAKRFSAFEARYQASVARCDLQIKLTSQGLKLFEESSPYLEDMRGVLRSALGHRAA